MTIFQILAVVLAGAYTMWLCHPSPRITFVVSLEWAAVITLALVAFLGVRWGLL